MDNGQANQYTRHEEHFTGRIIAIGGVDIRVVSAQGYDPSDDDCVNMIAAVSDAINVPITDLHYLFNRCNKRGRPYVIANNVTEGFAFDFMKGVASYSRHVSFDVVPAKHQTRRIENRDSMTVERLKHSLLCSESKVSELMNHIQNLNEKLTVASKDYEEATSLNVALKKKIQKLERALQREHGDVRIDKNDPDTYIVRPSALTEMRELGKLKDDVVTIVFQIPKGPIARSSPSDRSTSVPVLPHQSYKYLTQQLRRACRPNTRGSLRGAIRVNNLLRSLIANCWSCEVDYLRSHRSEIKLRNSKFLW